MIAKLTLASALLAAAGMLSFSQSTPRAQVDTYSSLADSILAIKHTESNFVRGVLEQHRAAAERAFRAGDAQAAVAEMSLFANEGDNAMAGVRKRLLEGGHHHNAEGESKGLYEPGFVIVTKQAKEQILAACGVLRGTSDADAQGAAWGRFEEATKPLLAVR